MSEAISISGSSYGGIAIAVALGAFIQGSVGFAFGLFAIPCVVLCGLPLEQAISLVLTLVLVQTATAAWRYRSDIPWPDVWLLTVYRLVTIPLGVWLLAILKQRCAPDRIKQFVGCMIFVALAFQLSARRSPGLRRHAGLWGAVAGMTSGLFAGLVGMGGPPLVLWLNAHDWSTQRVRSLLAILFLLMVPWQLTIVYLRFGDPILRVMVLALVYMPVVAISGWLGNLCGDRVPRSRLKVISYVLLVWIAVFSIFGPMW